MNDYSHPAPSGAPCGGADARGRLALIFDSAQGGLRGTRRWLQYGLYIRNVLHTDEWKDRVNPRRGPDFSPGPGAPANHTGKGNRRSFDSPPPD
jgi:hypothetical protein